MSAPTRRLHLGDGAREFPTDLPHQAEWVARTASMRGRALFWDCGVAKTRPAIETIVRAREAGRIGCAIVVAPEGVHRAWVLDELPRHCRIPYAAMYYEASAADTRAHRDDLARFLELAAGEPALLAVLVVTFDGLKTDAGVEACRDLVRRRRRYAAIVDESSRIANPTARRSKATRRLCDGAELVRILNGTPITNGPLTIYGQMLAIDPDYWRSRGFASFVSFESRFAVKQTIVISTTAAEAGGGGSRRRGAVVEPANPTPEQIAAYLDAVDVAGDVTTADDSEAPAPASPSTGDAATGGGRRIEVIVAYRELDVLRALIAEGSDRLTKEDAGLSLPPKVYRRLPVELHPEQRRAYDKLRDEYMLELDGGVLITATMAMVRILRLQQIACGYLPNPLDPEADPIEIPRDGKNPRLREALELLDDLPGKAIVWARFRRDVDKLVGALGDACVRYDGAVTRPADRAAAIDRFRRDDKCRRFVANPAAIATGVTLVEATHAVYYSNSFDYTMRVQSEDRQHRVGTTVSVTYDDVVALGTVDEKIVRSLVRKDRLAAETIGDRFREWLE